MLPPLASGGPRTARAAPPPWPVAAAWLALELACAATVAPSIWGYPLDTNPPPPSLYPPHPHHAHTHTHPLRSTPRPRRTGTAGAAGATRARPGAPGGPGSAARTSSRQAECAVVCCRRPAAPPVERACPACLPCRFTVRLSDPSQRPSTPSLHQECNFRDRTCRLPKCGDVSWRCRRECCEVRPVCLWAVPCACLPVAVVSPGVHCPTQSCPTASLFYLFRLCRSTRSVLESGTGRASAGW